MPSSRLRSFSTALALALVSLSVTGCLVLDSGTGATAVLIDKLKISVRSGTHPIAGATLQLYEADLTSYTGSSTARLPNPVLTGKDGTYTASTVLVCNPHSLFYLVATGGNAGAGDDPAIALITAVGACDDLATSQIVLNEATTVASAYALSGFMSSLTSVSANATVGANNGTKLALTGITNAFATVHNLVDIHTGVTLATTPAGNGTVPRAKVNSLANLLAACIESTGFSSRPCTGLVANAPSLAGIAPANTLQAILNIAHNPGANIPAIAVLLPAAPYTPALTAPPNDLTLSIIYKGTGTGGYQAIAADDTGHVWVAGSNINDQTDPGSVVDFGPLGTMVSTYAGGSTGISRPDAVAIDAFNNIWLANCGVYHPSVRTPSLTRIADGGTPILNIPQGIGNDCSPALASDGLGNIYSSYGTGYAAHTHYVQKYSNAGTPAGGNFPVTPDFYPVSSLALDGAGNIAVASVQGEVNFLTADGALTEYIVPLTISPTIFAGGAFDHTGNFFWGGEVNDFRYGDYAGSLSKLPPGPPSMSPTDYRWEINSGGLSLPQAVVVDGAGTQWISNLHGNNSQYPTLYQANISAFTSTSAKFSPGFSPATGFQAGLACGSLGIAVDITGNVWVADQCSPLVAEYVGVATPVTPLAIGVRDNTVGQRP